MKRNGPGKRTRARSTALCGRSDQLPCVSSRRRVTSISSDGEGARHRQAQLAWFESRNGPGSPRPPRHVVSRCVEFRCSGLDDVVNRGNFGLPRSIPSSARIGISRAPNASRWACVSQIGSPSCWCRSRSGSRLEAFCRKDAILVETLNGSVVLLSRQRCRANRIGMSGSLRGSGKNNPTPNANGVMRHAARCRLDGLRGRSNIVPQSSPIVFRSGPPRSPWRQRMVRLLVPTYDRSRSSLTIVARASEEHPPASLDAGGWPYTFSSSRASDASNA